MSYGKEKTLPPAQFKEYIERKVRNTIREYSLFTPKDKICVAVSGGKDSTTCLYILKKLGYKVEAIMIDPELGEYTKKNLENITKLCKEWKIKLHVVSFRKEFGKALCYMRSVLNSKGMNFSSCMLCGVLKRYLMNKYARKLKFNYLATGHNLDDEAQAFLMNVFRNDFQLARKQGPSSGIVSKKFVPRVKPLYLISEKETTHYSKLMKFPVNYGICPCSVNAHRRKHENLLNKFEKANPGIKYSIIRFQETMKSNLKENNKESLNLCSKCGEPAKGKVCRTCEILSLA